MLLGVSVTVVVDGGIGVKVVAGVGDESENGSSARSMIASINKERIAAAHSLRRGGAGSAPRPNGV